jgi:uncharacterized repeat protein (TIGR01451 family)
VGDSYPETPPSTTDPIIRVGDTVTYDLTLNLQEYTTRNVVVEDDLPVGMALESFTIIGGANFSYTLVAQPAAGATGTLHWEFGDITNQPSNDGTPVDALVIQYVARVVPDAPPVGVDYGTSILRNNLARLSYTGGDPAVYPDRLTATETIEVRQPQMSAISKTDLGTGRVGTGTATDPYQVNISTDVMNFQLSSCNDGLAPAYGVVIPDQLAPTRTPHRPLEVVRCGSRFWIALPSIRVNASRSITISVSTRISRFQRPGATRLDCLNTGHYRFPNRAESTRPQTLRKCG